MTFMSNHFMIVGPGHDPAGIADASSAVEAFSRIADTGSSFVSRGDDSGTHAREIQIWDETGHAPNADMDWYNPVGQGMGDTLLTASELQAYTLVDGATFIAMGDRVSSLAPLFQQEPGDEDGDSLLVNPYSVIAVNPERHPETEIESARAFIDWLGQAETRERIAEYGIDTYGRALFTLVEAQ